LWLRASWWPVRPRQSSSLSNRPATAKVDYAFLSPNADFSKYRTLILSQLEVYYPDSIPQPEDLDRLRQYFREAILAAFGNDFEITFEPAPETLRVNAQIIDLKIVGAQGTYQPSSRRREVVAEAS
jgi:hypothetical protein